MTQFTLSTLDNAAAQTYLRYALIFACGTDEIDNVTQNLQRATRSLVNEIPMLAGTVTHNNQQNLVVDVTLQQVNAFEASIAHHESPHESYAAVREQGVPPSLIMGERITPLDDDPGLNINPACAIQANFIEGGLILVIYLHHAVADIRGISTILRLMSEGMTLRTLDQETLDQEATTVSQARSRLSSGTGAPAFLVLARDIQQRQQQSRQQIQQDAASIQTSTNSSPRLDLAPNRAAILCFKLNIVNKTVELINARRRLKSGISGLSLADTVTPRDVLVAVIWRAYVRARWPLGREGDDQTTSISFPVDLRSYLVPPLESYWMGNAEVTAVANEEIMLLGTSYDLSSLERTAAIIHSTAKAAASDLLVRSRINLLNADPNPQDLQPAHLIVHDWTPVPKIEEQEMDLGLGLGRPDAIRRTGREVGKREAVLLPENEQRQIWEVQVELEHFWMDRILRDDLLRAFLLGVAI